jgi:hypothetical protein
MMRQESNSDLAATPRCTQPRFVSAIMGHKQWLDGTGGEASYVK